MAARSTSDHRAARALGVVVEMAGACPDCWSPSPWGLRYSSHGCLSIDERRRRNRSVNMTSTSNLNPDMRDLMAAVGEVLLTWGYFEAAILDRLTAIDDHAAGRAKTSPLFRWRTLEPITPTTAGMAAEIDRLAEIRHALAHGLKSATVDPDHPERASVTCRTIDGERRMAISTLIEARDSLHRLSHAIRSLPMPAR